MTVFLTKYFALSLDVITLVNFSIVRYYSSVQFNYIVTIYRME